MRIIVWFGARVKAIGITDNSSHSHTRMSTVCSSNGDSNSNGTTVIPEPIRISLRRGNIVSESTMITVIGQHEMVHSGLPRDPLEHYTQGCFFEGTGVIQWR